MAIEEFGEEVLVDKRIATLQSSDLTLVIVHARNFVPHLSKANGGNKADVSGSNDCYSHIFAHTVNERAKSLSRLPVLLQRIPALPLSANHPNGEEGIYT
jgi:hypothetical protein